MPDFRYTIKVERDPVLNTWVVKLDLHGFLSEQEARAMADGIVEQFAEEGVVSAARDS